MSVVKKDAPTELIEAIGRIEDVADQCFRSLAILRMPSNIACWSLLTGGIKMIEDEMAARGDQSSYFDATLINVGRVIPIGLGWAENYGRRPSELVFPRWSAGVATKVDEALATAQNYSDSLTCFPMWHKNRCAAEVLSPTLARFITGGSSRDRQVSAYQKGFRPKAGPHKESRPARPVQTLRAQRIFSEVFQRCRKTGKLRFKYEDPWDLWQELLPEYQKAVDRVVRRADSLILGDFTLRDFKSFYAAFLAICAAHEHLCFAWKKNFDSYPMDAAVLIRSFSNWSATISRLSGVSREKAESIIGDLTVDFASSLDLHVHPFVPMGNFLAVAPQFPLHSRPDENILRVCSLLRPAAFDAASLQKETELLTAVQELLPQYSPRGPISLPNPMPDIDLILVDEGCSTVVLIEMKWIRKTNRPIELIGRDADVIKGISQLEQIQDFMASNPDHLNSLRMIPKPLNAYNKVFYLLLSRDHWVWIEPGRGIAIVEFEAFSRVLKGADNLLSAMEELLNYQWLPIEGRDFTVRYDRAFANGVAIESEAFYPA